MMNPETGILITNLGTPEQPTPAAVRHYLKEFLSDKYVIKIPRAIWLPILYGYILPFRSSQSAKLYQKIWTADGSPLLQFTSRIKDQLAKQLTAPVALGMRYGKPSLHDALKQLQAREVKKILLLPLYPQYSDTTTASTIAQLNQLLKNEFQSMELQCIKSYAENPHYINALVISMQNMWQKLGPKQHLLFSFHGIPKRYVEAGDPYAEQCHRTATLVAEQLQLPRTRWSVAFQSRLGRAEWLKPYTDVVLKSFPQLGITHLDVICPGFPADCLETLEEIAIRGKEQFLENGGNSYRYISALNDSSEHIQALMKIIQEALST
jgi:ferrochelatase